MDQLMPKVKIFEITDESLSELGLALRNHNCRKIIILLTKKTLPVSQIAKELKIGVNIASDQVKVLRELDLLKITQKPIAKKGNDHNFYEFAHDIFLSAIPEENKLKRIFKETVKFASIGIASLFSFVFSLKSGEKWSTSYDNSSLSYDVLESIIFGLVVIIIGLILDKIHSWLKNKKRV